MIKDKSLTIFLAVITKDQKAVLERLQKTRGVSKSKVLRQLLEDAIKNLGLK